MNRTPENMRKCLQAIEYAADLNNYRIDVNHVLGEGSYSVVLPIYSRYRNRPLAAKVSSPLLTYAYFHDDVDSALYRETFSKELDVLRSIGWHPNIVRYVEHFSIKQSVKIEGENMLFRSHFIVMERANMPSLKKYIAQYGVFTEDNFKHFAIGLIGAVNYLHRRGIYHGDIKPENLMFHKSKRGVLLKLIDFGLATRTEMCNAYCGSMTTMSPESFRNQYLMKHTVDSECIVAFNARVSDCYSLGATIYYALHGEYPIWKKSNYRNALSILAEMFFTDDKIEKNPKIYFARVDRFYTKPSEHLSPECRQFLQALLEPNPNQREQSANFPGVFKWIHADSFNNAPMVQASQPETSTNEVASESAVIIEIGNEVERIPISPRENSDTINSGRTNRCCIIL